MLANNLAAPDNMEGRGSRKAGLKHFREEELPPYEDNERPPEYSPVVTKSAVLEWKPELTSPFRRATRRRWSQAKIEVNNTQLIVVQRSRMLRKTRYFSLQYADVGLAFDYFKRPWILRLRCEGKQFIVDTKSQRACYDWLMAILQGIALALPLELRTLPEDTRRIRRRNRRLLDRNGLRNSATLRSGAEEKRVYNLDPPSSVSQTLLTANEKRRPPRGRHVSNRDYPHLGLDASWERKVFLHNGRWAMVRERTITPIEI